eukprot:206346_1
MVSTKHLLCLSLLMMANYYEVECQCDWDEGIDEMIYLSDEFSVDQIQFAFDGRSFQVGPSTDSKVKQPMDYFVKQQDPYFARHGDWVYLTAYLPSTTSAQLFAKFRYKGGPKEAYIITNFKNSFSTQNLFQKPYLIRKKVVKCNNWDWQQRGAFVQLDLTGYKREGCALVDDFPQNDENR